MSGVDTKEIIEALLPAIDAAVKAAIGIAAPPAAIIADPVVDAVDAWVEHLLHGATPPPTPTPTNALQRIADAEKHLAALTIATGKNTSSALADAKVAAHAAPEVVEATDHETATADV